LKSEKPYEPANLHVRLAGFFWFPLKRTEAKKLILTILKDGSISFAQPHAMEHLKKHHMSTVDCLNVLRGGTAEDAEHENGEWR
jgi:hypothetical protein